MGVFGVVKTHTKKPVAALVDGKSEVKEASKTNEVKLCEI